MAYLLHNMTLKVKHKFKTNSWVSATLWTVAHLQLHITWVLVVISPVMPLRPHPSHSQEAPTSAAPRQAEEKCGWRSQRGDGGEGLCFGSTPQMYFGRRRACGGIWALGRRSYPGVTLVVNNYHKRSSCCAPAPSLLWVMTSHWIFPAECWLEIWVVKFLKGFKRKCLTKVSSK